MQITSVIDELLDILIEISDSDDFVRAVVGAAGNDENRQRIIDYIKVKQAKGVVPDSSQK